MANHWVTRCRTKSNRSGKMAKCESFCGPKTLEAISNHRLPSRRLSQGRPTATTSADDQYLTLCARKNRSATPNLLRSSLAAAYGRLVSTSTVRRRLEEGGLYARWPSICVPRTSRHRRDRLQWARQLIHWTPEQ